jgi:plasmid maintenance system antidote protein VapI
MLSSEQPNWVSPPGDTIINILDEQEMTIEQFANNIGKPLLEVQKIIDGSLIIDIQLARRLSQLLGSTQSFWLAREHDYRASVAPPKQAKVIQLSDLIQQLPISDMQKFGWMKKTTSKEDRIIECLTFFGVSSLAQWQGKYDDAFQKATYRRSSIYASSDIATTAWLRQGEIETSSSQIKAWSPDQLQAIIPRLRRLTWYKGPELFLPKLRALLSGAGVHFAVVRAPKGCVASGAVRIFKNDTPHIQLSFRYLSDDQFWFTLFHEIGHLLLHYDKMPILEDDKISESKIEKEANDFAAQIIVPPKHREEMYSLVNSRVQIINFAKKIGISPGLIVGQLQHEGILRYNQMQHLKRRFRWVN